MADIRMPPTHRVARLTILFVLALALFAFVFSGAPVSIAGWATDCAGRVATKLWAPLLDEGAARALERPVSGCFRDRSGDAG